MAPKLKANSSQIFEKLPQPEIKSKSMYDHKLIQYKDMRWLTDKLDLLESLGEAPETLDDIECIIQKIQMKKVNVVVERDD